MTEERNAPYVWVTWVTRLLSGEASCEWAAWFRAHHKYTKYEPPDAKPFDLVAWQARHAEALKARAIELTKIGYEVRVEDQNAFKITNAAGVTLAAKPDLVARRKNEVVVSEVKTGQPRSADSVQVSIYALSAKAAFRLDADTRTVAEVVYGGRAVRLTPNGVEAIREPFRKLMARVGGRFAPQRAPSWRECRWCDIGPSDCPARVDDKTDEAQATTDELF